MDSSGFERLLGEVYAAPAAAVLWPGGADAAPPAEQWYRLSDPGFEEALSDRLSFRRFVGLALADPVPDHSTSSCFPSQLARRGSRRAAAGGAEPAARRHEAGGRDRDADRREPGRRRQPAAEEGRAA